MKKIPLLLILLISFSAFGQKKKIKDTTSINPLQPLKDRITLLENRVDILTLQLNQSIEAGSNMLKGSMFALRAQMEINEKLDSLIISLRDQYSKELHLHVDSTRSIESLLLFNQLIPDPVVEGWKPPIATKKKMFSLFRRKRRDGVCYWSL